ncbi:MAG: class IV adenylate cyclase [Deltaproteobacteria bacterium]|nr:MAG: class IV adenylate cyclase [Deltaproteobacteria bacterium]
MVYEIEAKAWLDHPSAVERHIRKIAGFKKMEEKTDYYFTQSPPHEQPHDNCRLRIVGETAKLSFKNRRMVGKTEVNEEHELGLDDPLNLFRFLDRSGFRMFVIKHKKSKVYRQRKTPNARLEINQVKNLGNFLEIEILGKTRAVESSAIREIKNIFNALKIPEEKIEPRKYIELLLEKGRGNRYIYHPRARSVSRAYRPA